MAAMQVISLMLLSVLAANAQVTMPGRCPKPAVQANFDIARYLGKWYGIQRLPHSFQRGQCSTATYSLRSPGVVGVLNRALLADGRITSITGSATAKDPSEPAKLQVSFYEDSPPAPYWVLASDYDNYALVYSCTDLELVHNDSVWIMSRRPTLAEETLEELHSTLTSIGVRVDKLLSTNQDVAYCKAMNQ
ncbi:apolipoprotein D-like [Dunckerocampus dactyliophorus]|uniref:apolipoprotein D-like n=1 Tax=Dunckerocampus dactyliophorus TaxID=161453 RepID=UPI002407431F|nr:apolipoprotein D-like [Dunckerocampus dactyliophorus]